MKTPNKVLVCFALAALMVSCKDKSQQPTDLLVDIVEVQGNQAALHAEYPGAPNPDNAKPEMPLTGLPFL